MASSNIPIFALMKIKALIEVEVKTLHVDAGVRYWEDATVNGTEDVKGDLIPCREGDRWKPIINIDGGNITNWTLGVKASIHYKICDDGIYYVKDAEDKTILTEEGYVPSIMCPSRNGYGDYIIMEVDENGIIANWKPDLSDFDNKQ